MFSLFIFCRHWRQHLERKTICLDIFLLSDRQWVPNPSIYSDVFLTFPYDNYLYSTASTTICWRYHSNSVYTGSRLPNISNVKTRKRRNMVGINLIRNKRITFFQSVNVWINWLLKTKWYSLRPSSSVNIIFVNKSTHLPHQKTVNVYYLLVLLIVVGCFLVLFFCLVYLRIVGR